MNAAEAIHGMVSERDFQDAVVQLARLRGFKVYHPYRSDKSAPGWPDLCLMRPPKVYFWELKSSRGKVSAAQQEWLIGLQRCGLEATVMVPADWPLIEKLLT